MNTDAIRALKLQPTLQLFVLGCLTLGLYYAHYAARRSRVMNTFLRERDRIAPSFIVLLYGVGYLSAAVFIATLFFPDHGPLADLDFALGLGWGLTLLAWSFVARNRMNRLNAARPGDPSWFHGFWTFLFSPLYFNYKINTLAVQAGQDPGAIAA